MIPELSLAIDLRDRNDQLTAYWKACLWLWYVGDTLCVSCSFNIEIDALLSFLSRSIIRNSDLRLWLSDEE